MQSLTEFFAANVWPDAPGWLVPALVVLLTLIVLYVLIKSISGVRHRRHRVQHARLSIVDVEEVDGRRRLVLLRRDGVEHLIMIGGPSDIVIESGIGRQPPVATQAQRSEARPRKSEPVPAAISEPTAKKPPAAVEPVAVRPPVLPVAPTASPRPKTQPTVPARKEPTLTSATTTSPNDPDPERSAKLDGEIQELLAQMGRDGSKPSKTD